MNFLLVVSLLLAGTATLPAQVTYERILQAEKEPGNWLTYSGTYKGHHYSTLDQIKRDNVRNLELKWVFQARSLEKFQAAPLVVDGVMYVTHGKRIRGLRLRLRRGGVCAGGSRCGGWA